MNFGSSDEIPTTSSHVTTTTVTWKWREGKEDFDAKAAAPYIGHIIQYSRGELFPLLQNIPKNSENKDLCIASESKIRYTTNVFN